MTETKSKSIMRDIKGEDLYRERVESKKNGKNAVVNGARSATEKAIESAISDSFNNRVKPYLSSTG